ncbi:hypothetical protein LCGC14_2621520, partial [marine sediment metagenome]
IPHSTMFSNSHTFPGHEYCIILARIFAGIKLLEPDCGLILN